MMDDFSAPGSVARCIAKSEIESLLHRYAILAKDTAEEAKMALLFTADGVFRLPNGDAVHPKELLKVV